MCTIAIEYVKITLLTDVVLAHEASTLSIPFTAGSITSAWKPEIQKLQRCNKYNLINGIITSFVQHEGFIQIFTCINLDQIKSVNIEVTFLECFQNQHK